LSPPAGERPTSPVVIALSPILLRGEEARSEHRVPADAQTVVLELEGDPALLPAPASALEVGIETVEGVPIWAGEGRRAHDASRPALLATANVPAARLTRGDYLLTLSVRARGDGTLHRYFLRIAP
jgi:hypothetical protein